MSDSLNFTGTDLGDRSRGVARRGHRYQGSDDDETSVSGSEDEEDSGESQSGGSGQLTVRDDREEALIQSALQRINRAQAKGKADVKLNKDELAALERRRKRMREEAERLKSSGSGSDRKKRKEQRVAVPLSQLDPSSLKRRPAHPPRQDSLPARAAVSREDSPDYPPEYLPYPPMGYFAPPVSSQSRSRSGTHVPRPSSRARENGSPPVAFDYLQAPHSNHRHVSESSARPRSRGMPQDELWMPQQVDPFQYQTAGPRHAAYPGQPPPFSKRHVSTPAEMSYMQQRGGPGPSSRSRHGSARTSLSRVPDGESSDEDTASDELGNGAQIREPTRGRDSEIVVEVSPERGPERSKKKSSSPTKRKPVASGSRRKRK